MPAVLTYHSQNIAGHSTANNDHVAFAGDLKALYTSGTHIVSLSQLADWLDDKNDSLHEPCVCLTFDDGCDFDIKDIEWPGFGLQRSMVGIMQDFQQRHGRDALPGLHATSFVIASPQARKIIDRKSLFGQGWMSEAWWANPGGLLAVANHGWDHNHPDLLEHDGSARGFGTIDTHEQCRQQVIDAAEYIRGRSGTWPGFFAYPFGESSRYIREEFFPGHAEQHLTRAAFGTRAGSVTRDSDRWNLPRYVCGRDWRSPEQLLDLLATV